MTPEFTWASDRALRVKFANSDSDATHARVMAAYRAINTNRPALTADITAAYATLLVTFESPAIDHAESESVVRLCIGPSTDIAPQPSRTIEVPCCYDEPLAPDLADVARLHDMTPADVIAIHSTATYTVRFLGFSPGFPYMAGLPAQLHTPRLPSPRTRVPAGSVAIAGAQAGIYPQATPGGWRILGRTPLPIIDFARLTGGDPCLFAMGDRVHFRPITRVEFDQIARAHGATHA